MFKSVVLCLSVLSVRGENESVEGGICVLPNSDEGRCTKISACLEATEDKEFRSSTKTCGHIGDKPVVCCPRSDGLDDDCPPKTPRRPDLKFGRIAFEKCVEYQAQVVFPVSVTSVYGNLTSRMMSRDGCDDEPSALVAGDGGIGVDASRGQFPHMALLGYGKNVSSAKWICGGTIISDRFILTAGHCTVHRVLGQVAFARLGILKRSDPWLITRLYRIARVISHPDYRPPVKYNDIALLETEKRITFVNKFVSPACLDIEDDPPRDASATGWGALGERAGIANVLQIMDLTRFSLEECSKHYARFRLMPRGVDNETQLCYGHRLRPTDTCQGDSGGPLQTVHSSVGCMHQVVGVTSFGRSCGRTAQPGIYTRVRTFVPWIEGVVWPQ